MKNLLKIIIISFCFITPSLADDIRDFQIEGISVGDSLLKMYTEAQIKGWSKKDYKSKKYSRFNMKDNRLETYDEIQFHYLTNDKNYTVQSITAGIFFEDLSECFKKQFNVFDDIKKFLSDTKTDFIEKIDGGRTDKQSNVYRMTFNLESAAIIEVACVDWDDGMEWEDHLRVAVNDEKFLQWIQEEAYE